MKIKQHLALKGIEVNTKRSSHYTRDCRDNLKSGRRPLWARRRDCQTNERDNSLVARWSLGIRIVSRTRIGQSSWVCTSILPSHRVSSVFLTWSIFTCLAVTCLFITKKWVPETPWRKKTIVDIKWIPYPLIVLQSGLSMIWTREHTTNVASSPRVPWTNTGSAFWNQTLDIESRFSPMVNNSI